jgi:hypothetical protein
MKVSELNAKPRKSQPVVTIHIEPGKVSPAQVRQFKSAFARLIAKAVEAEHEQP